jgi:hypothetical protein
VFDIKDMEREFGKSKIKVNGITFVLTKVDEMSGTLALWVRENNTHKKDNYQIYATPSFDGVPVPVEVFDEDYFSVGCKEYDNEIYDFEEYKEVVTRLVKEILDGISK